jgi:tRNA-modifying protein YgfZ
LSSDFANESLATMNAIQLAQLQPLLISGPDARAFLQGQLSADLEALDSRSALLASCNSPQGRVQAVTWLLQRSDGIALLLPSSMVESITARLRKYVLRSKVTMTAGSLRAATQSRAELPTAISLAHPRAHVEHDQTSYLDVPGHDDVLLLTAQAVAAPQSATELKWRLDDIRAGLPQIHPQTHEAFVAQMLNLDLLEGVSFTKGCYTGQEIIARTHYRGAIKRRMFRFEATCPPPAPGTRIVVGEQLAGEIVDAAPTAQGCELLAVISLAQLGASLQVEGTAAPLVRAELPYAVPSS